MFSSVAHITPAPAKASTFLHGVCLYYQKEGPLHLFIYLFKIPVFFRYGHGNYKLLKWYCYMSCVMLCNDTFYTLNPGE